MAFTFHYFSVHDSLKQSADESVLKIIDAALHMYMLCTNAATLTTDFTIGIFSSCIMGNVGFSIF